MRTWRIANWRRVSCPRIYIAIIVSPLIGVHKGIYVEISLG